MLGVAVQGVSAFDSFFDQPAPFGRWKALVDFQRIAEIPEDKIRRDFDLLILFFAWETE